MSNTKIKAGQFSGIVSNGTDGYFLMTNGDGSMSWAEASTGPSVTSVTYPGDDLAANPAGGQTVVLTGTNFGSSMTVSIGGTTAPSVAHDSSTQLTITTPAKAAGDYDIVVTNTVTGASGTFVNGISYNGVPTWTTAAGSLGTFDSETTISTITLQATEPDGGTITFNITNGSLPSGLSLTGANIDGTTTAESSTTLYSFTIEAIDDENQATPRNFSITVNSAELVPSKNFTINTYTGNGSTQSIEGKIGTAASFNGSGGFITTSQVVDANSAFSISMWINPVDVSGCMLYTNNAVGGFAFGYDIDNTSQGLGVWRAGVGNFFTSGDDVTANTWQHIVLTYNGTTGWKIYLDNVEIHTETIAQNTFASATQSYIGRDRSTSFDYNGKMDQVRIFDKAISSSEVTTLYGENNTSTTKSTTDIFDDGSGVALYEFEEGAKDTGGKNGYIGSAGVFNGSSSKINLPNSFFDNNASHSLSFWVFFNDASPASEQQIFFAGEENFRLQTDGTLRFRRWTGSGNDIDSSAVSENQWYHITCTYNTASGMVLYINGTSVGTNSSTTNVSTNVTRSLGYRGDNNSAYFNGKIDQVRIFNKTLSSSEVTTLYGETSASSTKSTTDIFDDGSGIALYELEGNANDTALYGRGAIDEGQSAVFNGSSSFIDTNFTVPASSTFSVSWWQNLSYVGSNEYIFSDADTSGSDQSFAVFHTGTTLGVVGTGFGNIPLSTTTIGSWMHFAVVLNGTTLKIYKNGSEIQSRSITARTAAGNRSLTIGRLGDYSGQTTFNITGSIDQVRIYSSALSASNVEALVSETSVPTANLVAHYKLDGDATDETTNYNGTASNVTYSDPAEFPTYDGTATNVSYAYDGTPTNVNFLGMAFQPDLVITKSRSFAEKANVFDSVRGATERLYTAGTHAEATQSNSLTSFNSNGFSIGDWSDINTNNATFVSWCWKAGGAAVSNTDGSITSTVSANQDAGFSIVKWTGTGAAATIAHGLSFVPELILFKNLDSASHWDTYNVTVGASKRLELSSSAAASAANIAFFNNTNPTSSVFSVGTGLHTNGSGDDLIAYCFHSVDGYQKVGSYAGNGTNQTINVGFTPRFVMIKAYTNSSAYTSWAIFDSQRLVSYDDTNPLYANMDAAEGTRGNGSGDGDVLEIIFVADTGFKLGDASRNNSSDELNDPNNDYIYLAIA